MSIEKSMHSLGNLTKEFKSAEGRYLEIESETQKKITDWTWASGPIHRMEPWEIERNGLKEGTVLNKEPEQKKNKYCYGKDNDGKIVTIRIGTEFEDSFEEEFYFFGENTILSYRYNTFQEPVNIRSRLINHGQIAETLLVGEMGSRKESFIYQDKLLNRIQVEEYDAAGSTASSAYSAEFNYDNKGLVSIVYKFPNGFERYQFHRK